MIGRVLTQEQVSRYNPTTNRCYVRLEVRAMSFDDIGKYNESTYLKDGQTGNCWPSMSVSQTDNLVIWASGVVRKSLVFRTISRLAWTVKSASRSET